MNVAAAVVAKPVAGSPPSPGEPAAAPVPTYPVQRAPSGKCK